MSTDGRLQTNDEAPSDYGAKCAESLNRQRCWSSRTLSYGRRASPYDGRNGGWRTTETGELARHVLSRHAQRYYRHLLAGPYRLLQLHDEFARIFLHGELPVHGDFSEQLASRMQIITNRPLIGAVDQLYYDVGTDGTGASKRGALTRTRPGNLRRLVDVIDQFDLTYDLYAMTTEQIPSLLPSEFKHWKS